MRLIDDWRRVLRYSASLKFIVIAMFFTGTEAALQVAGDYLPIGRGWLSFLSFVVMGGAFGARLIAQQKISGGGDADQ